MLPTHIHIPITTLLGRDRYLISPVLDHLMDGSLQDYIFDGFRRLTDVVSRLRRLMRGE